MTKHRIISLLLVVLLVGIGYFVYASQVKKDSFISKFPFKLGLDLNGGTELVYKADTTKVGQGQIKDSMDTLRDVIERRVNIFGVSEPIVQVEEAGVISGNSDYRLIVELPGVTDVNQAIAMIGQTPSLEFRLLKDSAASSTPEELASSTIDEVFTATGLTGGLLQNSQLEFDQTTGQPLVSLSFNSEGRDLFAKITKENVGKVMAIFLDGKVISSPVIREEIKNGKAQISGGFTPEEAKTLVRNLNYGALPVPISLASTQSVGASLGQDALNAGVKAGIWGFLLVIIFLIVWYRLPGIIASISLVMYVILSLALFKLIPVTLTAAGVAGFILSIGMAVDANILIFERMKEELKKGKDVEEAMKEGFHRAWLSIRDSNISSMITALVLFWLGTSAVKGFALTFGVGVVVSMFTAITVSRTFLFAISSKSKSRFVKFLFSNGLHF